MFKKFIYFDFELKNYYIQRRIIELLTKIVNNIPTVGIQVGVKACLVFIQNFLFSFFVGIDNLFP